MARWARVSQRIRQAMMQKSARRFPESHAASFALIAYASAWVRVSLC